MGKTAKAWIEATRPRTLPVSVAGVMGGLACSLTFGHFRLLPFLICLVFALLAQIVSNFANEYYDYKSGIDRKGREGFRRGVTEGDIRPATMKRVTFILLGADCLIGASLIIWGGWWLIFVGLLIAIFALAYSAGPFPLSRIGLGDIAVVIFYGIIPVCFTAYLTGGTSAHMQLTAPVGLALGLLADNVLIVNNYRDAVDDKKVGKLTTVVIFGRKIMLGVYCLNFTLALTVITVFFVINRPVVWIVCWAVIEILYIFVAAKIAGNSGAALNPRLKQTAQLMLLTCAAMIVAAAT
ncbi:MAG: 1,4-dihydroxy-2-naphthoate octaprenyltransferase [Muribaculaceae bacterium]|nr:1,4-dihydroxy-2-naphthoate octaprenyltransferase [Muribaculaceae bacterium]